MKAVIEKHAQPSRGAAPKERLLSPRRDTRGPRASLRKFEAADVWLRLRMLCPTVIFTITFSMGGGGPRLDN
jgi:hypothetical protein